MKKAVNTEHRATKLCGSVVGMTKALGAVSETISSLLFDP